MFLTGERDIIEKAIGAFDEHLIAISYKYFKVLEDWKHLEAEKYKYVQHKMQFEKLLSENS